MGFRQANIYIKALAEHLKLDEATVKEAVNQSLSGGIARIWSIEDKGKYTVAKISTSKKNADGGYDTDFQSNFVRLIGAAHTKVQELDVGEKGIPIRITACEATTPYNAETKKGYNNYIVYAFDILESNSNSKTKAKPKPAEVEDDDDSDLPF